MKKLFLLAGILVLLGCEQIPEDPDNAIVSGYVYRRAVPVDSVCENNEWKYIDWEFYDPAESVHIWVEGDINSSVPYIGPDVDGYTDATGFFSIPIYLGHNEAKDANGNIVGYDYVDYADVQVLAIHTVGPDALKYEFEGGITLGRGKEFRLFTIALTWFN